MDKQPALITAAVVAFGTPNRHRAPAGFVALVREASTADTDAQAALDAELAEVRSRWATALADSRATVAASADTVRLGVVWAVHVAGHDRSDLAARCSALDGAAVSTWRHRLADLAAGRLDELDAVQTAAVAVVLDELGVAAPVTTSATVAPIGSAGGRRTARRAS